MIAAGNVCAETSQNNPSSASLKVHTSSQTQPSVASPPWAQADTAMQLPKIDLQPSAAPNNVGMRFSVDKWNLKSSFGQTPVFHPTEKKSFLASPYNTDHLGTGPLDASFHDTTRETDMAAGVGYRFDFMDNRFSLTPVLGLSYHAEDRSNKATDLPPKLAGTSDPDALPFQNISELRSWWFGVDLSFHLVTDLFVESSLVIHNTAYENPGAVALTTDADKAVQPDTSLASGEAEGKVFTLGIRQQLGKSWSAGLMYSWQEWLTADGKKFLIHTDAAKDRETKKSEDPFSWDNQKVNVSLSYDF